MKTIFRAILLALFAASGLFATAASAGTAWDGGYLGLNIGGTFPKAHTTTSTVFNPAAYFASSSVPAIAAVGNQHSSTSSLSGGIEGGWNWREGGNWVIGLEGDVTAMGATATSSGSRTYPCCAPTNFTVSSAVSQNWMISVRPKIGWVLGSADEMVYVTGGWAVTEAKGSFLFTDTFATAHEAASRTTTRGGFTVGAGAAAPIGGGWSVKAEYLYSEFGTATFTGGTLTAFTPPIPFANVFTHTMSLRDNMVRIGIDYQFD